MDGKVKACAMWANCSASAFPARMDTHNNAFWDERTARWVGFTRTDTAPYGRCSARTESLAVPRGPGPDLGSMFGAWIRGSIDPPGAPHRLCQGPPQPQGLGAGRRSVDFERWTPAETAMCGNCSATYGDCDQLYALVGAPED